MTASSNFFDFTMTHVRLSILKFLLFEVPTHVSNESLVASRMETLGLPVTRDQTRTQLTWLEEQQLIRLNRASDDLLVVSLRERGGEVARGMSRVDGVARPSPGR